MGNVLSSAPTGRGHTDNVSESDTMNDMDVTREQDSNEDVYEEANEIEARAKAKEQDMDKFKKQLEIKREQRREILARHRAEKEDLEKALQSERLSKMELYESNRQLRELLVENNIAIPEDIQACRENTELSDAVIHIREEFEKLKADNNKLRRDLVEANSSLQNAFSDIADLNSQNTECIKQIRALKEVVSVSKTLINLREDQLNELKSKLNDIDRTLADRETNLLSADLRQEYERQLQNIRTLRGLYDERARLAEVTRQGLARELEEHKILYQIEINKSKNLSDKVEELEAKVDALHEIIENKNNQIDTCQDETNGLKAEMSVVNKLFSQVLLGYKTKQDLDTLVHRLEENHGLLTHMAERENDSEASSALPKLLLELVSQVDNKEEHNGSNQGTQRTTYAIEEKQKNAGELDSQNATTSNTTPEEIVENLPKVWRVLMELLSHQTVPENNSPEKVTTCYKSVETKSGPVLVPSVSQTYIRLKDLIVEKLGLVKEVNRMKQLNTHLESRLEEQERRLCLVTSELSKTWHVVGRLRRHHHQLHTHEKILKYELQQKRKLLNELKEELEYCREKWEQAREKHTQSEIDWKKLRAEFSSRKTKVGTPSLNNSAESGYSDERQSDESSESNDESEYVAEPLIRCKKKLTKSFETILDSSTDYNQAAEREDPASDMIDVADLPLDTQDGDDNHEISDLSKSENLLKCEKLCEETEDEIGDITHDDSCTEDLSAEIKEISNNSVIHGDLAVEPIDDSHKDDNCTVPTTSVEEQPTEKKYPEEVLRNIKLQNERLAKKDEKLEHLEISSAMLLEKTQTTANYSDQINITLDHLINRPTSSCNKTSNDKLTTDNVSGSADVSKQSSGENSFQFQTVNTEIGNIVDQSNVSSENTLHLNHSASSDDKELMHVFPSDDISKEIISSEEKDSSETDTVIENITNTPIVDFKSILENVRRQNERLAKKDQRLQNIETGCAKVVDNISETLKSGEEIVVKLDILHNRFSNANNGSPDEVIKEESNQNIEKNSEASTSSELDHEARFAARDLRLKRLEEQTKSLVNKVNKTTTKGIKIHYKLEELHNIYGSENSRASTPSEDNTDKSNDNNDDEPRSE